MRIPSSYRLLPWCAALTFVSCGGGEADEVAPPASPGRDWIVVVHGFGPTQNLCAPLASELEASGFSTLLFDYPSATESFSRGGELLRAELDRLAADPTVRKIHLVTHSMGGIVSRVALRDHTPVKLGRIVMIAPPNRGSPKANVFAPLFSWWLDPLGELRTHDDSAVNRLPPVRGLCVGVIAGDNDWTVPPEYTTLEGAADLLLYEEGFAATHNGLMLTNDDLPRQVIFFLDHGVFDRTPREDLSPK